MAEETEDGTSTMDSQLVTKTDISGDMLTEMLLNGQISDLTELIETLFNEK